MQPFRGTYDQLPAIAMQHRVISEAVYGLARLYGFEAIATPIFEYSQTFSRTLGDTSDIVTKEMFAFPDRHGETLVLRPEGTAGIMRAVLTHKLHTHAPLKFFYTGPMFRYERPQKGRYRQFHHVGVECIGDGSPFADVEVIALAHQVLGALLPPAVRTALTLEINTLGDPESRDKYRHALVTYFEQVKGKLSAESQERLVKNPLRILDSKAPEDRALIQGAPQMAESLNEVSKEFFKRVCEGLEILNIPYTHNPYVVRGLDYYCHTVFEFTSTQLGAQSAVLAGGRYDGLSTQMGGPHLPSVGWAAGMERLALLMEELPPFPRPVAVLALGDAAELEALKITQALRNGYIATELVVGSTLKALLKRADKMRATYGIILGEDELKQGACLIKNLDTGHQEMVKLSEIATHMHARLYP